MENLKSLEQLLFTILTKTKLSPYVSRKDLKVLRTRIAAEGVAFLTTKLPELDKGLLALCQMQGDLSPSLIPTHNGLDINTARAARNYPAAPSCSTSSEASPVGDACTPVVNTGGPFSWKQEVATSASLENTILSSLSAEVGSLTLPRPSGSSPSGVEEVAGIARERLKTLFSGFSLAKDCVYPRLFVRAWENIFEKDGTLRALDQIDTDAVLLIRQVSHLFYKLELPFTNEQICSTMEAFKQADIEVGEVQYDYGAACPVLTRARLLVRRLLAGVNPLEINPKHGSGSSACGVEPHRRYESFRYIPRLAEVFPYDEYFFYSKSHLVDELHKLTEAEVEDPPAKVVLVPKDSRGPRLISEEPREFMYVQQGLMKLLYDTVASIPAVAGQIGFTDQSRNQDLAHAGSLNGEFATLDLKEASDRVSWELVNYLFPENWVKALGASRSLSTVLPNGDTVTFNKFAPMGSAVCFPVETICFWAIALAACGVNSRSLNRTPTDARGRTLSVSVFGDDIIVPTQHAEKVMRALRSVGLVVNDKKSFLAGPFRESCGGDYFNGNRVVPVRCKAIPTRDDMRSAFRTAEMFNNIIRTYGYERIGYVLEDLFNEMFGFRIPVSNRYRSEGDLDKTSIGLYLIGPYTDVAQHYKRRWNRDLQVTEYYIPCMLGRSYEIDPTGWSLLLRKACLKLSEIKANRIAQPKRYRIKHRWTQL